MEVCLSHDEQHMDLLACIRAGCGRCRARVSNHKMSLALPSLHKLSLGGDGERPVQAERVDTILDDPEMTPDLLRYIQRLVRDPRRDHDPNDCLILLWDAFPEERQRPTGVQVLTARAHSPAVRGSDAHDLRACVDQFLVTRGGPLPLDAYQAPPAHEPASRADLHLKYRFLWAKSTQPQKGLNRTVLADLAAAATADFAARTDRRIDHAWNAIVPSLSSRDGTTLQYRLCGMPHGAEDFLGKVVAKSFRAADVGASCGADDRFWGEENREAAKALVQHTPDWYAARKGRLTASSAYKALGLQYQGRRSDVVEDVLFGHSALAETADMRWGAAHEEAGIAAYRAIAGGANVRSTGLWVLRGALNPMTGALGAQRSWFGASPDGVVVDPTTGKPIGLVEVKCKSPLAFDRNAPHGGIGPLAQTGVRLDEAKKTPVSNASPSKLLSEYVYVQAILQLRATELPWCDVVFWTPYWMRVVRVRANNALAEELLAHLTLLYQAICANAKTLREAHATDRDHFWRLCTPASDGAGGLLPDRLNASSWNKRLRADKAADGLVDWQLWKEGGLAYSAERLGAAGEAAADAHVAEFIRNHLAPADVQLFAPSPDAPMEVGAPLDDDALQANGGPLPGAPAMEGKSAPAPFATRKTFSPSGEDVDQTLAFHFGPPTTPAPFATRKTFTPSGEDVDQTLAFHIGPPTTPAPFATRKTFTPSKEDVDQTLAFQFGPPTTPAPFATRKTFTPSSEGVDQALPFHFGPLATPNLA